MKIRTEPQLIKDTQGQPIFVIIPFGEYQKMVEQYIASDEDKYVPSSVVELVFLKKLSFVKAWRIYQKLTQKEAAQKMGITQSAWSHLEARKILRSSTRIKVAQALNIDESQLDF